MYREGNVLLRKRRGVGGMVATLGGKGDVAGKVLL